MFCLSTPLAALRADLSRFIRMDDMEVIRSDDEHDGEGDEEGDGEVMEEENQDVTIVSTISSLTSAGNSHNGGSFLSTEDFGLYRGPGRS